MKLRIKKTELMVILLLLASFQVDSFQYILPSSMATVFNYWLPILVCCVMAVRLLLLRHVSSIMLYIGAFFAFLFAVTLYKSPDNFQAVVTQSTPPLATALITEFYMKRNAKEYLKAVLVLLLSLIIIDLFSMILFPDGMYATEMYTECWFLGYKTARVRLATMPVVMIAAIISVKEEATLNGMYWLVSVIALADTFFSQNMGGTVTIAAMIFLIFLLYGSKREKIRLTLIRLFHFKVCLLVILIAAIIINVMQNLSFFEPIMQAVSGKSTSMIARTRIWTTSIQLLQESPLIGKGYVLSRYFAQLVGFAEATQPHSIFLAVLVYSGVVGLLLFLILINKSLSCVNTRKSDSASPICAVYIICMLVHGIISMHLFAQFFYAAMILLYYAGNHLDEDSAAPSKEKTKQWNTDERKMQQETLYLG